MSDPEEDDKEDECQCSHVCPGSEGVTSVSSSSKRNATDLPADEPGTSFVRVQEVMVDPQVLDLFNVDERLEKEALEHTQWELEPGEQKLKTTMLRNMQRSGAIACLANENLRGAPHYWQEQLADLMLGMGVARLFSDKIVFVSEQMSDLGHVDDLIVTRISQSRAWIFQVATKISSWTTFLARCDW